MASHEQGETASSAKRQTLERFYRTLQDWEGVQRRELIQRWPEDRRTSIAAALSNCFDTSGMLGKGIPGYAGSNPQSGGNKAAAFLRQNLVGVQGYQLDVIKGAGYPDFILKWDGGWCCAEAKSTSKLDTDATSLRIVLTGSTGRLRAYLDKLGPDAPAPCHMLYTLKHDSQGIVRGMRLDFLEPETLVAVKLEASTSQQMLAAGNHHAHDYTGCGKPAATPVEAD